MPLPTDWWRLDATDQAALVRDGRATPLELVDGCIARIERLNPAINAVVTPLYEEARVIAADLPDAAQPFRGVPILLKDAGEELEGTPYYVGTALLRDIQHRSTQTTEFVRRLLNAGFIPVGKANVPPLSSGFSTEPAAFGPTRNPWDRTRSAGGSSGGSAAAVAAGMVAVAHGSDANGSIRVPAACCGLVTLRPSRGMVPTAVPLELPNVGEVWKSFVLARSVRDLATTFDAVAEPSVVPGAPAEGLRIGMMLDDPDWSGSVHADVVAGVRDAAELLAARGHTIEESHPAALDGLFGSLGDLPLPVSSMQTELTYRWLEERVGRRLDHGDIDAPLLDARPDAMPSQSAVDGAVEVVTARFEEALEWWDDFDVMLMPAMRQPAWPLGNSDWDAVGILPMEFTHIGFPSLVLPIGMTTGGLPLAVQLVARHGADRQLLALARQLEADAPWADRWPSLAFAIEPPRAAIE